MSFSPANATGAAAVEAWRIRVTHLNEHERMPWVDEADTMMRDHSFVMRMTLRN